MSSSYFQMVVYTVFCELSQEVYAQRVQVPNGCKSSCLDTQVSLNYTRMYDEGCKLAESWPSRDEAHVNGQVENLQVYASQQGYAGSDRDDTRESWSDIIVKWEVLQHAYKRRNAFHVTRYTNAFTGQRTCYIYNITANALSIQIKETCERCPRSHRQTGWDWPCYPETQEDGRYTVEVLLLPLSKPIPHHTTFITISGPKTSDQQPKKKNSYSCWLTDPVITMDACNRSITLTFELVPSQFITAIEKYTIWFIMCGMSIEKEETLHETSRLQGDFEESHFHSLTVNYPEMEIGDTWTVKIRPIFSVCDGECGFNNMCLQTASFPFTILNASDLYCSHRNSHRSELTIFSTETNYQGIYAGISTTNAHTLAKMGESGGLDSMTIVTIIVGCVAGIILSALTTFIISPFYRQCKANRTGSRTGKKKVMILYSNDHPHHQTVVNLFAIFLRDSCFCEVYFELWSQAEIKQRGFNEWLTNNLEVSDKIIIVLSPGAVRKKVNVVYRTRLKPSIHEEYNTDLCVEAFRFLISQKKDFEQKTNYVSFPYHHHNGNEDKINIPNDLDKLLLRLHEAKKLPNPLAAAVRLSVEEDNPKARLQTAIDKMISVVQNNNDWFDTHNGFHGYDVHSYGMGHDLASLSPTVGTTSTNDSQTRLLPRDAISIPTDQPASHFGDHPSASYHYESADRRHIYVNPRVLHDQAYPQDGDISAESHPQQALSNISQTDISDKGPTTEISLGASAAETSYSDAMSEATDFEEQFNTDFDYIQSLRDNSQLHSGTHTHF